MLLEVDVIETIHFCHSIFNQQLCYLYFIDTYKNKGRFKFDYSRWKVCSHIKFFVVYRIWAPSGRVRLVELHVQAIHKMTET